MRRLPGDEFELQPRRVAGRAGQQKAPFVGFEFPLLQHRLHLAQQREVEFHFGAHFAHAAWQIARQQHAGEAQRLTFVLKNTVRNFVRQDEGERLVGGGTLVQEGLENDDLATGQCHRIDVGQANNGKRPRQSLTEPVLFARLGHEVGKNTLEPFAAAAAAELPTLLGPHCQSSQGARGGTFDFFG